MEKEKFLNMLAEKGVPANCREKWFNSQNWHEAKYGQMDPQALNTMVETAVQKGCRSPF